MMETFFKQVDEDSMEMKNDAWKPRKMMKKRREEWSWDASWRRWGQPTSKGKEKSVKDYPKWT